MRFLVTGTSGQLGYDITLELKDRGYSDILATDYENLDITDEIKVRQVILDYKPSIIFHCAAYTFVDKAETEQELCYKVNVEGTKNIVKYATEVGAKVIYFSTDYVFDGSKEGEYIPEDTPCPTNYYGLTKYLGEQEVQKHSNHIIARISWVFGINGNNFVKTMMKLGRMKDCLNVVDDQIGSPTYTKDLAHLIVDMAISDAIGTFHITNEGFCSWYEFAKEIMNVCNIDIELKPIKTSEYNSIATRPLNSKMSKDKLIEKGFYKLPNWKSALNRYYEEYIKSMNGGCE